MAVGLRFMGSLRRRAPHLLWAGKSRERVSIDGALSKRPGDFPDSSRDCANRRTYTDNLRGSAIELRQNIDDFTEPFGRGVRLCVRHVL